MTTTVYDHELGTAGVSPTPWKRICDTFGCGLTAADVWFCMAAAALGRCVLESFADYGRWYCGHPAARIEPTRWQEEDLARLLDVPPSADRR